MIVPKVTHRDPSILKLSMLFIFLQWFFLDLDRIEEYLIKEIRFNKVT